VGGTKEGNWGINAKKRKAAGGWGSRAAKKRRSSWGAKDDSASD